ncbi:MAG TPA: helix-turn-helix transcriptional regulator [Oscillospiraceae bacterium]|nr:helix-turn-helix transcriptional regulator [Oscillospiraceae bacterium]
MKNRIRSLREQRGLTQKELGAQVGVSRQAVNAVETGKFDPSLRLAHALAAYFGITMEALFDFSEGGI